MAAAAAEAAGLEEMDLDQNLLELGLDSLRAAEFASQACPSLRCCLHCSSVHPSCSAVSHLEKPLTTSASCFTHVLASCKLPKYMCKAWPEC